MVIVLILYPHADIIIRLKRIDLIEYNFIDLFIRNLPLIIIIIVIFLNFLNFNLKLSKIYNNYYFYLKIKRLITLINKGFEFDIIYNNIILSNLFNLCKIIGKRIDKGILELITAYGLINKLQFNSKLLANLDYGNIYILIINILFGIIIIDNINILELIIILSSLFIINKLFIKS